ncbi:MAG: hypothetical protein ACTSVO_05560 [Candidatus Heimdallarchaeaceae archaeon]
MPYRVDIYIGSDNNSRKICKEYMKKIIEWADVTFPEGYTLLKGEGCYDGIYEETIIINVLSNYDVSLNGRLKRLKCELEQNAILVVKFPIQMETI